MSNIIANKNIVLNKLKNILEENQQPINDFDISNQNHWLNLIEILNNNNDYETIKEIKSESYSFNNLSLANYDIKVFQIQLDEENTTYIKCVSEKETQDGFSKPLFFKFLKPIKVPIFEMEKTSNFIGQLFNKPKQNKKTIIKFIEFEPI